MSRWKRAVAVCGPTPVLTLSGHVLSTLLRQNNRKSEKYSDILTLLDWAFFMLKPEATHFYLKLFSLPFSGGKCSFPKSSHQLNNKELSNFRLLLGFYIKLANLNYPALGRIISYFITIKTIQKKKQKKEFFRNVTSKPIFLFLSKSQLTKELWAFQVFENASL